MPTGPAARLTDTTAHGAPLAPGPGSATVLIGNLPAWRAVPLAAAAGVASAGTTAAATVNAAYAAMTAAAGTPGAPAAVAAYTTAQTTATTSMQSLMKGTGADTSMCPMLPPPHGPGVVITGSVTVLINGFPASRVGDTIQEATSVNTVALGCMTVIIGG